MSSAGSWVKRATHTTAVIPKRTTPSISQRTDRPVGLAGPIGAGRSVFFKFFTSVIALSFEKTLGLRVDGRNSTYYRSFPHIRDTSGRTTENPRGLVRAGSVGSL